jgi:carbon storage regulator
VLILSRKKSEQIIIGDNILVTVIAVSGNHVRLGVQAPRNIAVNREEMLNSPKEKKSGDGPPVQLSLPFPEE